LDTYAQVLQNFDPIGNYSAVDEVGRPVDASVTFSAPSPLGPGKISGPTAFAQKLISTNVFAGCAVQKMFSYVVGQVISANNTCALGPLRTQFAGSDGTISSLLVDVVLTNDVRARAGGVK
jgi:alkyl sulfatase BDS1-like metallo-beta-lactamase superfamily hydrolase